MAPVRRLSDYMINLIAAGEVVERPASVVKELLENAIDAGAGNISIELQRGGRKSIVIRDDGAGMNRHDLLMAVERHATSKISLPEDLDRIGTLGFRGEALPSIAGVSRMTILTSNGHEGWKLTIAAGEVKDLVPAARSRGTTITVEALFYNQPARRKFLSSESTELAWVERMVTGCALASIDTAFTLTHEEKTIFSLPCGEPPEERLRRRYSLAQADSCLTSRGVSGSVAASLIVFPGKLWNSRRNQYILVNGRLVSSAVVSGIVNDALEGPAGSPLFLCTLELPHDSVDVNAHPTKKEVRFRDSGAVRAAVLKCTESMPRERARELAAAYPAVAHAFRPDTRGVQAAFELSAPARTFFSQPPSIQAEEWADAVPIMQVNNSYLVTASGTGLLVVDQHAAHERVLFEQILESMQGAEAGGRQQLLLPEVLELDTGGLALAELYGPLIVQAGFDMRISGNRLEILSVPVGVHRGAEAVREVLSSFASGAEASLSQPEVLAAATACKGSVTFGQRLGPEEIRTLFHRLFATSDPFHCPHGRPTLVEITFEELEKRFGR
ncbi:MAG: DNA mismatch repair endonuclease MutL [Candidatus Fermentibacteraceae bacterium]